jgi:hypothetical protein
MLFRKKATASGVRVPVEARQEAAKAASISASQSKHCNVGPLPRDLKLVPKR